MDCIPTVSAGMGWLNVWKSGLQIPGSKVSPTEGGCKISLLPRVLHSADLFSELKMPAPEVGASGSLWVGSEASGRWWPPCRVNVQSKIVLSSSATFPFEVLTILANLRAPNPNALRILQKLPNIHATSNDSRLGNRNCLPQVWLCQPQWIKVLSPDFPERNYQQIFINLSYQLLLCTQQQPSFAIVSRWLLYKCVPTLCHMLDLVLLKEKKLQCSGACWNLVSNQRIHLSQKQV